jgi:hypothetical protein
MYIDYENQFQTILIPRLCCTKNQYADPNINMLITKADNIPSHLLFLFLIISIDNIVEAIKEKAMKMKFNPAPPNVLL